MDHRSNNWMGVMAACIIAVACLIAFLFLRDDKALLNEFSQSFEYQSAVREITGYLDAEFDGKPFVVVNNNRPLFDVKTVLQNERNEFFDFASEGAFVYVKRLKSVSEEADLDVDLPGWHAIKYDSVPGNGYLFRKKNLIGSAISGTAGMNKVFVATQYLCDEGMSVFEQKVEECLVFSGNSVLYRVTPVFEEGELIPRAVQLEAMSVEDNGDSLCFNVLCYNAQPGVVIDYTTGESSLEEEKEIGE